MPSNKFVFSTGRDRFAMTREVPTAKKRQPIIKDTRIPIGLTLRQIVDKVEGSKDSVINYINGIAIKTREHLGIVTKFRYQSLEY